MDPDVRPNRLIHGMAGTQPIPRGSSIQIERKDLQGDGKGDSQSPGPDPDKRNPRHPRSVSSAPFLCQLERAALIALPLVLLDIDRAIRLVGRRLEAIRDELAIANVARVQGWAGDGFGAHIHRFVQNEMRRVLDQTVQNQSQGGRAEDRPWHYFYLWNPDTDWYPIFEEANRAAPLGPAFGGYHHDLDAICLRMRADRETLLQTTSHGRTAMFHLLIPSYSPIVIDHPVAFHPGLLPLTVTGQRHRDVDFVWFNLLARPPALQLNCIGLLKTEMNAAIKWGSIAALAGWSVTLASCAVAIAFPPCAPLAADIAVGCCSAATASWGTTFIGGCIYDSLAEEELHVLGRAVFLPES